jgi:thiol:disulfide interchange protein/DsbC/DsbD-like thiol-disulfide interchange protein
VRLLAAFIAACSFFISTPLKADPALATSAQEITKATLVSEFDAITPGQPLHVGVLLEPREGWHTYWENPGDAGMATELIWSLPEGFAAGNIDWPAPHRVLEGPLVTFSYTGNIFLPTTITVPAALDATGRHTLRVLARWLVCKEVCIPESAELEITLPVTIAAATPTPAAALFTQHRANAVKPLATTASYTTRNTEIMLYIPLSALGKNDIQNAIFFPRQSDVVNYTAPSSFKVEGDNLLITMGLKDKVPSKELSGVLTVTSSNGQDSHFDVKLSPSDGAPAPAKPSTPATDNPANPASNNTSNNLNSTSNTDLGTNSGSLLLYFGLAVMGGLILNLMPCVLPVLSLKALAIAKKAGESPAAVRKLGLAYTAGVLYSFAIIALLLIVLRNSGEAIGWGYQMQSPAFVGFLIYLLFLVGLNLSGLFEMPVLFGNVSMRANDTTVSGSFFTGVLATAVATPCTAPFMASAVGAALTMPTLQALLIFEGLGLGLALPFLLISYFPSLLKLLPKPGAWMEAFKQFLAFPMYGSVIWLMWVLTLQTSAGGMAIALSGMLAIVLIIWLRSCFNRESRIATVAALIAYILVFASSLIALERIEAARLMPAAHMSNGPQEVAYSKEKLAELRSAGKPVFVDATAAWCITCQVNAKVAIHTEKTMQLFRDKGVTLMIADWTRRNPDITELLSSFGHKGVPLYIYYPPKGGEPVILPQLLSEDIISGVINK